MVGTRRGRRQRSRRSATELLCAFLPMRLCSLLLFPPVRCWCPLLLPFSQLLKIASCLRSHHHHTPLLLPALPRPLPPPLVSPPFAHASPQAERLSAQSQAQLQPQQQQPPGRRREAYATLLVGEPFVLAVRTLGRSLKLTGTDR